MATTRSRPHGREHARPSSGGVASEHAAKIYAAAISGIVVIVAFLALTGTGHVIDAATQHFMLFYAGVFALIALCASVGLGLIATDRMFLSAGRRVFVQSAHRAASFGAVTFLIIHIVTEILAQRVHVLDAVIPFLSPFRTFYIGLGTIASDLIILLVITGIMRGRFNANGKAWRWRAIHYVSYLSFVFGVWHGLLGGRPGKPYVDWSYGFIVAFVAIGLAVRILSNSLRPKEKLSAPPVPAAAASASAPMRAAAMFAQLSAARAAGQSRLVLSATTESVRPAPVAVARHAAPMLTAPLPAGPVLAGGEMRSPKYEPGYEGPPRYLGAPRDLGPGPSPVDGPGFWPQDEHGSLSDWGSGHTGPQPRLSTGSFPRADSGSFPQAGTRAFPQAGTGPNPRPGTGPWPRADSGPLPRAGTGPMPRAATGPMPRAGSEPMPRAATGPLPRSGTGPMPRAAGPMNEAGVQDRWSSRGGPGTGPVRRADSGPMPRAATGGQPRLPSGPYSYVDPGPMPRAATGPLPRAGTGSFPRADSGPVPRAAGGPQPRPGTGPMQRPRTGPMPRAGSGPMPAARGPVFPPGFDGPGGRGGQPGRHDRPRGGPNSGQAPWDGGFPEPDPDFRYREPGPGMPGYRGSRDHLYGGDVRS